MPARNPCFSPKTLAFFRQLEKNNTREWFTPRKELFKEQVHTPMIELVRWVNDRLRKFAVEHVVDPPSKAIYRIYRDTRFSKDKTPYKDHIGATYPRRGLSKHGGAGYYFGVSHKEVQIAGGMYMPEPEELQAVRQAFVKDEKKLAGLLKKCGKFAGELQGDQLARLPKSYEADPLSFLEGMLRRKQLYFYLTLPPALATTPNIGPEVVKRFKAMQPLVDFINEAILAAKLEEESGIPKRPTPMF